MTSSILALRAARPVRVRRRLVEGPFGAGQRPSLLIKAAQDIARR
jgi:hypothetical protein